MRTRTAAALSIIVALALPAGATAGGWAVVRLSSTPDGLAPGAPWNVEIEVLQHGRTPLDDVQPKVLIISADKSLRRTFATRPAGRPGVHRATVTFPRAGIWRYTVDDGFTARHQYPAVRIDDRAGLVVRDGAGGDSTGIAFDRLGLALLAGLAAAALAVGLPRVRGRRRRAALLGG